jgi:hypothetical protein
MFGTYRLPVLSTVPRSGTWFLRYLFAFVCHLEQGGRLDDLLTGEVIGDPQGAAFDFNRFRGGPLFRVGGTLPDEHMFIGHTVCPGFHDMVPATHWWRRTSFHVPGYDCFHEEKSYRHTPVDLASYNHAPVRVSAMDRVARKGQGAPIALVYRNPVDQAFSYFRYCQAHVSPAYHLFRGRPVADMSFREYLFDAALISYARQFLSYQLQAERYPHLVKMIPYENLIDRPVETATICSTISAARTVSGRRCPPPRDWCGRNTCAPSRTSVAARSTVPATVRTATCARRGIPSGTGWRTLRFATKQ